MNHTPNRPVFSHFWIAEFDDDDNPPARDAIAPFTVHLQED